MINPFKWRINTKDKLIEDSEEKDRLFKNERYWQYYRGEHWATKAKPGINQITCNYSKAFINKLVNFIAGQGFTINMPNGNQDILAFLYKIWGADKKGAIKNKILYEMAQMGAITGDIFVKVTWNELLGKVEIKTYDSSLVFPIWTDKDTFDAVYIFNYRTDEQGKLVLDSEKITKDEIREYRNDIEILDRRRENILHTIPVVHIKNYPDASKKYGISDLEDIVALNKEYNLKASTISDVIDYHVEPVTIVKGAKLSNVTKGANKVWSGIPKDGDVFNLELKGDLNAAIVYLKTIKQAMHEVSGIPEATLGQMQPISNTSGIALHIQYLPLMERIWAKRITLTEGLQKINELVIKILNIKDDKFISNIKLDKLENPFDTEIKWYDPLPKDEALQNENLRMELDMGIESKAGAIQRKGYYSDIESKMAEIEEEQSKINDSIYDRIKQIEHE